MTDPLLPGDPAELGGYRLLGRLGQGGMGSVYLGQDTGGRLVAVKMIRPEFANDTEFRGRFRSEVNRARQVPPFCTAEVLDADPDHPTPYLVVEFVDGPSLSEVIAQHGPLSGGSLHSVAVGVATALAAIHGAGVIHRDLKPGNVLFALGTPKVIDFGIARAFEATSRHTRTDQMVGTVSYMAPERFDADHDGVVGPAADVFAWGAVVAYAGTGRTPFRADSPAATAARILTQPPELSGLPEPLRQVVARTLAKDPVERPTAHELLDLLLDLGTGGKAELMPPELLQAAAAAQRAPSSRRRRMRGLVLAAVATLVLGAAGFLIPRLDLASNATAGTAASLPASAPSPVPAPSWRRDTAGRAIVDRLDRPGQWAETTNDAEGRCVFSGGRLEARTGMSPVYRCHGPRQSFTRDQAIVVDAAILTPGACAALWFRTAGANAYLVSVCETEVRLGVDTEDGVTDEVKATTAGAGLGRVRKIEVVVQNEAATVVVDGTVVLTGRLGKSSLAAGPATVGVLDDTISGDARVAFAHAEVLKLLPAGAPTTTSVPQPRFADLTQGGTTSVVKVHGYDAKNASAVVEPIIFMTGDAYCRAFKIKRSDNRCVHQEYVTEESHTEVTVPIAATAKYLTWEDTNGDVCIDAPEKGGTCPMTEKQFADWFELNKQGMVAVATEDGAITRFAVIYTP